jgi:hypothetical protein
MSVEMRQAREEQELRVKEALDRFYKHEQDESDLSMIRWSTGLTNYLPPKGKHSERERRISK